MTRRTKILALLLTVDEMSTSRMCAVLGCANTGVNTVLRLMVDDRLVESTGATYGTDKGLKRRVFCAEPKSYRLTDAGRKEATRPAVVSKPRGPYVAPIAKLDRVWPRVASVFHLGAAL